MATIDALIQADLKHIWHPCMQMKDLAASPPLVVESARGSYLYTNQGPIIDGIASWWCKSLGHNHPAVVSAIKTQLEKFEHISTFNTTHPLLAELGERLAALSKNQHVFFASDGSSAIEIAMKLALHACQLRGQTARNKFIALENSYHGETFGSLAVSDLGLYKKPYESQLPKTFFLKSLPYVQDKSDPLWADATPIWPQILAQLEPLKEQTCAILIEPIVQGAGGMRLYSADFLNKLAAWALKEGVYLIADEIMTGLGRTGQWLALEHACAQADLICLSKGLTSGSIPFSVVLIDSAIYELFYDDYEQGKSFLHSHTYSGHALGVAAALATLKAMAAENILTQVATLESLMQRHLSEIAKLSQCLDSPRVIGGIAAAELVDDENRPRLGYKLHLEALSRGALIRPLGKTLYWMPPLNSSQETIEKLAEITLNSIRAIY